MASCPAPQYYQTSPRSLVTLKIPRDVSHVCRSSPILFTDVHGPWSHFTWHLSNPTAATWEEQGCRRLSLKAQLVLCLLWDWEMGESIFSPCWSCSSSIHRKSPALVVSPKHPPRSSLFAPCRHWNCPLTFCLRSLSAGELYPGPQPGCGSTAPHLPGFFFGSFASSHTLHKSCS